MKYNKAFFYSVLENELDYIAIDFPFCHCIKMNALDAFRYSVLSNSGYLDLRQIGNRLIISKDSFRIFNQAEKESIQHGVFDGNNPVLKYTANYFFNKFPYILANNKYVVFIEYQTRQQTEEPSYYYVLRELNNEILSYNMNPNDFIVTLIPSDSSPKYLESFFEFVINERYRRNGFLTDSQLPFYYGVGTPDSGAYCCKVLQDEIFKPLGISGASTIDLMCVKYLNKERCNYSSKEESIVFEVKTGSTDGSQIVKYINKDVFSSAYEVIPHKKVMSKYAGLISFTDDGRLEKKDGNTLIDANFDKYKEWLFVYLKCYLIANLSNKELQNFKTKNSILYTTDLVSKLKRMSFTDILKEII